MLICNREHDAKDVIGVDISEKMLTVEKEKTDKNICYICKSIEDIFLFKIHLT
ncbi:ubiquinone/menaquinone biosynthesis C-methylase UbiE [Brassicibacter mesophilus]